jgi:hypothetical protein
MIGANKMWLLSSGHRFLKIRGKKNVGSKNDIHQKSAPHAFREDAGRKDQGQALLEEGSTPSTSDEDDPIVTDVVAHAIGECNGSYRTLSFAQGHEGRDM